MVTGTSRDNHPYKPGQVVPISGIYTVVHAGHRPDHLVVAIRGESFPVCRVCQANVVFYSTHPTAHMTHDFDLAGPTMPEPPVRAKAAKKGES
jgi:hypothetical protein